MTVQPGDAVPPGDRPQHRMEGRRPGPRPEAATDEEHLLCVPPSAMPRADAEWVGRIAAEVGAAFARLAAVGPAVSVFGSARTKPGDPEYELAVAVAAELGRGGFAVITGGGPGTMEAANRGVRESGGLSIGLSIELRHPQLTNPYVDLHLHFRHFFVRKLMFIRYACAFVVFPGGYGTMDELFEALTLIQTGKIWHFPVILAGAGGWDLSSLLAGLVDGGRLSRADLELIRWEEDPVRIRALVEQAYADQAGQQPT